MPALNTRHHFLERENTMAFKKVKNVTLPLIKLENKREYFLRFDGAMHQGKTVDDKKEPPIMAEVTDMETGEQGLIILGQVLRENLKAAYPEDSYVGKIFSIEKSAPEGARKYSLWNIAEVEEEADSAAAKPAKGKK